MIMIPLPYVISLVALVVAVREWFAFERTDRNATFALFLVLLAFQAALIGTRFGYGQEWLREIQPLTAAILPPLAYLSFRERMTMPKLLIHTLPFFIALGLALFASDFLDAMLAANNLTYGYLLARIGKRGTDGLSWAGLHRARNWLALLWIIFSQLVYSGVTDIIISADYFLTSGQNTFSIVGWASALGLLGVLVSGAIIWFQSNSQTDNSKGDLVNDSEVLSTFERVDALLKGERLYLDPDLNLNRIARRMTLPARDVSRAINVHAKQNVSQYVNALRIAEACRLMNAEDVSVTAVIYSSGFNTKSNFNREFLRVIGKTPSAWRQSRSI